MPVLCVNYYIKFYYMMFTCTYMPWFSLVQVFTASRRDSSSHLGVTALGLDQFVATLVLCIVCDHKGSVSTVTTL